jgi:hypothetical protein
MLKSIEKEGFCMGIAGIRGAALGLAVATVLQGCSLLPATRVDSGNPAVVTDTSQPYAKVYFIRPRTERNMGEADNALDIDLNNSHLLSLVKGEYTLVNLKPGKSVVTVNSVTAMYLKATELRKMSRDTEFKFAAGKTYYIVMQMVNGEFRGIYDVAEEVKPMKARRIVKYLRPIGQAKREPIDPV